MKCPKCKNEIKKGDKFCENCGEKLQVKKKKRMNSKIWVPAGIGGILVLAVLIVLLFISPQKAEANKLQEQLDLGNKYLEDAEYEKAKVAFNEALKIDEKSPDAAIGLAEVYNNKKDPEKALTFLKKASDNLNYVSEKNGKNNSNNSSSAWKEKSETYKQVFDTTSSLFLEQGNESKAAETREEQIKADKAIMVIIEQVGNTEKKSEEKEEKSEDPEKEPEKEEKPEEDSLEQTDGENSESGINGGDVKQVGQNQTETDSDTEAEPGTEADRDTEEIRDEEEPQFTGNDEDETEQEVILDAYIQDTILAQNSWAAFDGGIIAYDYENSQESLSGLNGILEIRKEDSDRDGIPEIFVVSALDGRITFDIYKMADGEINKTASVTALCDGFGTALERMDYRSTQECFIKEDGENFFVGIVSCYFGANDENGNPETVTNFEMYQVAGDGSTSLNCAVSIRNGITVYTNNDRNNGNDGGKEEFLRYLSQSGISGEWINIYADTLAGMDLMNNPEQDFSSVSDPLNDGLETWEPGVRDLVTLAADIAAGSGSMSVWLSAGEYPIRASASIEAENEVTEILNPDDATGEATAEDAEEPAAEDAENAEEPVEEETENTDESPAEDVVIEILNPDDNVEESQEENGYAVNAENLPENVEVLPEETVPEESEISAEELINNYVETVILAQSSWANYNGISVSYNYSDGAGSVSGLNGIIGIHKEDLDKDGNSEILVISQKSGKLAFDIYKAVDGNVYQTSSTIAVCDGFGTALDRMSYGSTQECFIRETEDFCFVGIASSYYGANDGNGNPGTVTNFEIYKIEGDGSATLSCAVSILNGITVYTNGDRGNGSDGGKEAFLSYLSSNGMSGGWIQSYADTLMGMDLVNNPEQDLSVVPGPLDSGLSTWESGIQDLVTVKANMSAGSGSLNISLQNNTNY